jgi:hypothetical protein
MALSAYNTYWPGDFEDTLLGGVYSSNRGVTLADGENHTPGGERSWAVGKGYAHLELLTEAHSDYLLSFWAKSEQALTVEIKIIHPSEPNQAGKVEPVEEVREIPLEVTGKWERYELRFNSGVPYPGPVVSEVLFSLWSPEEGLTFIDDLKLAKLSPGDPAPDLLPTHLIEEKAQTLTIRAESPHQDDARTQKIDATSLAGKRIQISADVTYLSDQSPASSWAALVFELRDGTEQSSPTLTSTPSPFWLPIGHAAPPAQPKRISAIYDIPPEVAELTLRTILQSKVGLNSVKVSNVNLSILP